MKKQTSLIDDVIYFLEVLTLFYSILLLWLWFFGREYFLKLFLIGVGALVLIIGTFIFFKRLESKRKEKIMESINTLGLTEDVNNFLNRAGRERGKNTWKYAGYGFFDETIRIFTKTLKEKGLRIRNEEDLKFILQTFIDKKQEELIKGSFESDQYKFSSLNRDGTEFENLLMKLFEKMSYLVEHPGHAGDQGGDLILNKAGQRILVQAKCYTNNSGNDSVQQAIAAKKYYDCNQAWVVCSSDFTREAIELAKIHEVKLVGKRELQELLLTYLDESWV